MPPSLPPDVPCSSFCCWTHVHGAEGGAWTPGWLIFVDWMPDWFWRIGCLPAPWEDWVWSYLQAARERKNEAEARALEEALEGYREAARERKRLAEERKNAEAIKALEDAGEPWKAIALERKMKEAAAKPPTAAAAAAAAKHEIKDKVAAKKPVQTRRQRMASQGPPRSSPPRKSSPPRPSTSSPLYIEAQRLPPPAGSPVHRPLLPLQHELDDGALRHSPPSKKELDEALRLLGHTTKGQVAMMVQRVLTHENSIAASTMSAGLAEAVANARREKSQRRAGAQSPPTLGAEDAATSGDAAGGGAGSPSGSTALL